MKGVWLGRDADAEALRVAARNCGRSDWEIETIEPALVYSNKERDRFLRDAHFIVMPLSLPDFWSFRLVELANRVGSKTLLILWSHTDASPFALSRLFDAAYQTDALMEEILTRAEGVITRERRPDHTAELIERVTGTSTMLRTSREGRAPTAREIREYQGEQRGSAPPGIVRSELPPEAPPEVMRALEEQYPDAIRKWAKEGRGLSQKAREGTVAAPKPTGIGAEADRGSTVVGLELSRSRTWLFIGSAVAIVAIVAGVVVATGMQILTGTQLVVCLAILSVTTIVYYALVFGREMRLRVDVSKDKQGLEVHAGKKAS